MAAVIMACAARLIGLANLVHFMRTVVNIASVNGRGIYDPLRYGLNLGISSRRRDRCMDILACRHGCRVCDRRLIGHRRLVAWRAIACAGILAIMA